MHLVSMMWSPEMPINKLLIWIRSIHAIFLPFSNISTDEAITRLWNDKPGERCSGRVEMRQVHQWGTVCQRGWDLEDAAVVCRELNCGFVLDVPNGARFGRPSVDVLWRDVKCSGDEFTLDLCERSLNEGMCTHDEDAGVECTGKILIKDLKSLGCFYYVLKICSQICFFIKVNFLHLPCLFTRGSMSIRPERLFTLNALPRTGSLSLTFICTKEV